MWVRRLFQGDYLMTPFLYITQTCPHSQNTFFFIYILINYLILSYQLNYTYYYSGKLIKKN